LSKPKLTKSCGAEEEEQEELKNGRKIKQGEREREGGERSNIDKKTMKLT